MPRPPAHIRASVEGFKEWNRAGKYLAQYGMISDIDRAMFTCYIDSWMTYLEAVEMIGKAAKASGGSGLFVKTPNGFPVQSPWLAVKNKAIEFMDKFSDKFGMSPAARTRVTPSDVQLSLPFGDEAKPAGGFHAL